MFAYIAYQTSMPSLYLNPKNPGTMRALLL